MVQVQGYAAQSAKAPLSPYAFERREPRDNDIAIDIQYCGICRTDIHQVRDEWAKLTLGYLGRHNDLECVLLDSLWIPCM